MCISRKTIKTAPLLATNNSFQGQHAPACSCASYFSPHSIRSAWRSCAGASYRKLSEMFNSHGCTNYRWSFYTRSPHSKTDGAHRRHEQRFHCLAHMDGPFTASTDNDHDTQTLHSVHSSHTSYTPRNAAVFSTPARRQLLYVSRYCLHCICCVRNGATSLSPVVITDT